LEFKEQQAYVMFTQRMTSKDSFCDLMWSNRHTSATSTQNTSPKFKDFASFIAKLRVKWQEIYLAKTNEWILNPQHTPLMSPHYLNLDSGVLMTKPNTTKQLPNLVAQKACLNSQIQTFDTIILKQVELSHLGTGLKKNLCALKTKFPRSK